MLTDRERAAWEQDGFVSLGQVAGEGELAALQARIDAIMLGEVVYPGMYFQMDSVTGEYGSLDFQAGYQGPSLGYRKIQDLERDPLFLAYIQNPRFRGIAGQLLGREVSVYRAMFMNKPAGRGTLLPYHQDGGSQWGLDRERFFTVWTALDPATPETGCLEVVPGSHRLGLLSERGHALSPEDEARHCPPGSSRLLTARPGEALLLHNYLLHRSGVNRAEHPRRAFSVVYMDGETRRVKDGTAFPRVFGEGALLPAPEGGRSDAPAPLT